jgi:hypothetical protein
MNRWIAPAGVSIGLIALYVFLPGLFRPKIEVRFYNGEAYIHVEKDDTIKFTKKGQDQDVTFEGDPCVETTPAPPPAPPSPKIHVCKVKVASGLYKFNCVGCTDPGIAVGSSTQ